MSNSTKCYFKTEPCAIYTSVYNCFVLTLTRPKKYSKYNFKKYSTICCSNRASLIVN